MKNAIIFWLYPIIHQVFEALHATLNHTRSILASRVHCAFYGLLKSQNFDHKNCDFITEWV